MKFKLLVPKREIREWALRYGELMNDATPVQSGALAQVRGYVTRAEFLAMTRWKSPRTQPRCAANSDEFIKAVTSVALGTTEERLAIEVLTLLDGVSWPTASVILHFCSVRPYPILDYRALWSLSCPARPSDYDFELWWDYVGTTRRLAGDLGVSMRTLDRALWAYSKENQ
jgi:hypothetical protein